MLPLFQCLKKVRAGKITMITNNDKGTIKLDLYVGEGQPLATQEVTPGYMAQHRPEIGGYFVQYGSGYETYSPGKEFEEGYIELPAVVPF
ncbi:hypothetical protein pEaSNUABM37_00277 [Erwinia phage pEa_SNUABM_37]|nr:hypothetical protein pEaSNUABM37_00277 [Erwinia phage pEa_SNUABM_37]QXO10745.1 hypothetical protein pEaSNUABM48_00277 [Erwinia phage pEa_SNUABM_48]